MNRKILNLGTPLRFRLTITIAFLFASSLLGCATSSSPPDYGVKSTFTDTQGRTLICGTNDASQLLEAISQINECLKQAQAKGEIGTTLADPDPWELVSDDGHKQFYIKSKGKERNAEFVLMWNLTEYKNGLTASDQRDLDSKTLSVEGRDQYDCKKSRTRKTFIDEFDRHMGLGNTLYWKNISMPWSPVESGTLNEKLWKIACGIAKTGV